MMRVDSRAAACAALFSLVLTAAATAGGPWFHSESYYQAHSEDPPGARQVCKHGKLWPPVHRPTGPEQLWIHKYHNAYYWPYPYNEIDEAHTRDLISQQAAVGWQEATTLHEYHFDSESNRLNSAGRQHLAWIIASVPMQYRTAFVAAGESADIAEARMASVSQSAAEMGGPSVPPIHLKTDFFRGRPAVEIDTLRRLELMSTPKPRLFTVGTVNKGTSTNQNAVSQQTQQGTGGSGR